MESTLTPFEQKLRQYIRDKGDKALEKFFKKGKNTLRLVLEAAQKNGINLETIAQAENKGLEDGSLNTVFGINILERVILPKPEVEEYRKNIQPFLTAGQNERFAEKLAAMLYEKLDDETKKVLTTRKICTYILNLGFLRLPRVSHRTAIKFIVRYKPLFKNETEVLESVLERLVEEEVAATPIEQTREKIASLKEEMQKIYRTVVQ